MTYDRSQELAERYARTLRQTMRTKRSTTVGHAEGEITVKYHDTIVFRYYVDTGDIEIDTGGFETYTTKARINECFEDCDIPARVYQETRRKRANDPPWYDASHRRQWWVWFRPNARRYRLDQKLHFKREACFAYPKEAS